MDYIVQLINPHTLDINEERAMYWLNVGAQPTDTVKSLLSQKGIILKRELVRRGLSDEKVSAELENWEKMREAKANTAATKKKKSKKAAAKEEVVSEEKVVKEEISNDSTAEVKGAASEENTDEKE